MTGLSVLLLGVGLGLRHATDADHVVVVAALVQREPGIGRSARVAALWGLGHTAAFFGLGVLIVLAEVRIPVSFERATELLVAAMLIGFGLWHLAKSRHAAKHPPGARIASNYGRPILIGVVHGLAGSAAIALLAATTIQSRLLAVAYLALFGLGTVLGMVVLTVVMSRPISWTMGRQGILKRGLTVLAALLSMTLGAVIVVRMVFSVGTP